MPVFINHYVCPTCKRVWREVWTAECDSECPRCQERHLPPRHSREFFGLAFRNKKSGKMYLVMGEAFNATNDRDGQHMIRYEGQDRDGDWQTFVRDINEFHEKFER